MAWVREGSAGYAQRKQLYEGGKNAGEQEMRQLEKTLAMIQFKCWYYETAMRGGNDDGISAMLLDRLPPEIQKVYDQ